MQIVIKWQDTTITAPNWFDFPISDINHMPVSHAVGLFSNNVVPIVIKENEQYLVNTQELLNSYKKKGSKVMMIQELPTIDPARMDQKLYVAGFVS